MHGRNEKNIKFSIRPHFELILVTHPHIIENVRPLYHANVISILLVEALSRKSINRHSRKISTWHSFHPVSLAVVTVQRVRRLQIFRLISTHYKTRYAISKDLAYARFRQCQYKCLSPSLQHICRSSSHRLQVAVV